MEKLHERAQRSANRAEHKVRHDPFKVSLVINEYVFHELKDNIQNDGQGLQALWELGHMQHWSSKILCFQLASGLDVHSS